MTEFDFDTIDREGIEYYVIPEGIMLYHGSDSVEEINGRPDFREGLHTFFALNPEYAANYAKRTGNVFMFETIAPIELVAMDKQNDTMYANAVNQKVDGYDIQTIMHENYGFNNNHKRKSEPEKDNALSQYLCENDFNGYAAGDMEGVNLTYDLDPEIVLCNTDKLEYIGRKNVGSHDEAPRIQDKRRKTRRIYDSPEKKPSGMGLFRNDDDVYNNIFSPRFTENLNFDGYKTPGGKKKKTTKRNKPKKASKKKQTKKRHVKKQTKKRRAKK